MTRTRGIKMKAKKEKKKITLREYHKKRMVTGIAILVTEIFENTAEHYKLDNTTWATVIFVVLAAMTALFAVIWLYASCQKVDKEDEMEKLSVRFVRNQISILVTFAPNCLVTHGRRSQRVVRKLACACHEECEQP